MNEVTLNPLDQRIKMYIQGVVNNNVETPVKYAFNGEWPVKLSLLELEEVIEAVEQQPQIKPQNSDKEMALKYLDEKMAVCQ